MPKQAKEVTQVADMGSLESTRKSSANVHMSCLNSAAAKRT